MSFLNEIATKLVSSGVGVINTSIFISSKANIPTGAGPYLSIIETGGSGSAKTQNDTATQRPTALLLARGADYPNTRALLKAAYDALGGANGLYNVTLSGTFYLSITIRQELTDIGTDSAARAMVSFNIDAEKQPS